MKGFLDFVREQGVVGLAIGFILGGSVSRLVSSFVNDLVNPLIGILLSRAGDLSDAYVQLGPSRLMWGNFLSNAIDFTIIAAIVYYVFKGLKLDRIDKKKQ
jgi:large conductance mechanosensitive channel